MLLQQGTKAPDFELYSGPDKKIALQDFRGQRLILVFYPADWSPVCGDQIGLYNETLKFFSKYNAAITGISVDSRWCHQAYTDARHLHFPLLADFEPKGAVAKAYGAYNEKDGVCERALFVVDEEGIIQWSYLSPIDMNPGADGILEALEQMNAVHK